MRIGEKGYVIKPRNTGKMRTQSQIHSYWIFSFTLLLFLLLEKENFKGVMLLLDGASSWVI